MKQQGIIIDYFAKQLFTTIANLFKVYYYPILMSWGINNLNYVYRSKSDYYVEFEVQGFKYQGKIQILYNLDSDSFRIKLLNDSLIKEVDEVYINEVITVLDNLIEKTDNYDEDVENWLNK